MPSPVLTDFDRLCIHRRIVLVEILRRFPEKVKDWSSEVAKAVDCAATLLAVRASGQDLGGYSATTYQRLLQDLHEWESGRLKEAENAIEAVGDNWVIENSAEYEPAVSLMQVTYAQGWTDFEGSVHATRQALKLSEYRGAFPGARSGIDEDVDQLPVDDEQVGLTIEMILNDDLSSHLFYVTKDGKFRLGDTEVRDALASLTDEVKPVHEERGERLPDDLAEDVPGEEFAEDIAALEEFRAFRRSLEEERDRLDDSEPMALAIDNFDDLTSRRCSVRELSARENVDRERLGHAYGVLSARLQHFLRD